MKPHNQNAGFPLPSFYRSKDPDDAFKHFFVLCCMFGPPEEHTCAGCAKAFGTWPGISPCDPWWVSYVTCDACHATMKELPDGESYTPLTTSVEHNDVTRAIDARIAANNVWQLPLPEYDEDGNEVTA